MADSVQLNKKSDHSWFDWIQLLVSLSIPLVIVVYTIVQYNNDLSIAETNRQQDLEIAERRYKHDIQLAEDRRLQDLSLSAEKQEEDILLNYFNSLGKLLEKNGMNLNGTAAGKRIARFTTITALNQLGPKRKTLVILSLLENELITIRQDGNPTIVLSSANLTGLSLIDTMNIDTPRLSTRINCISLDRTILINASFQHRSFTSCSFKNAHLIDSDFSSSNGVPVPCLNGYSLHSIDFAESVLGGSTFIYADYFAANFKRASLQNAQLEYFTCDHCDFEEATLDSTDMSRAFFDNSNFAYAQLKSSLLRNTQLNGNNFVLAKLYDVDATEASLDSCDLYGAMLVGSVFMKCIIFNSSFDYATLTNCSFSKARVASSTFDKATMHNVDFSHAECHHCRFHMTNFTGANFRNASLLGSDFTGALLTYEQLRLARSLKSVILPNGTVVD